MINLRTSKESDKFLKLAIFDTEQWHNNTSDCVLFSKLCLFELGLWAIDSFANVFQSYLLLALLCGLCKILLLIELSSSFDSLFELKRAPFGGLPLSTQLVLGRWFTKNELISTAASFTLIVVAFGVILQFFEILLFVIICGFTTDSTLKVFCLLVIILTSV